MGKTSIDGLAVRTSSRTPASRRVGTVAARVKSKSTARRSTDGIRPTSSKPKSSAADPLVSSLDLISSPKAPPKKPTLKKPTASADDDFLSPVEGLGFTDVDDVFVAADDKDWSDLLDEVNDKNPSSKKDNDLSLDSKGFLDDELFGDEKNPDESSQKSKKDKKDKKGKGGKSKKHKIIRRIFLGILALFLIAGIVILIWGNALISRLTNGNSSIWDIFGALVSETIPFETDENGRTNVLVFGTEGYNMDGAVGNGQHDGSQLTDSIMVISFDQKTKDVALLSIPRDLKVSQACYAGKINEVYTCNNDNGNNETAGVEALEEQLGEILGIEFQYWAHVNWGSLTSIVDTLGGITVTLDEDISDYYNTGTVISAGVPTAINGEQALGLARARYGTQGGDFSRGGSQQKIVEAIIQKMIQNGVGLSEALNLLNILGDNLRSNFSTDNIKAGLQLMSGFDTNSIRNVSLVDYENGVYYVKTDSINGISFVVPSLGVGRYGDIHKFIDQAFSSNPAAREGAEIAVYNATNVSGVASAEQTRLEDDGYVIYDIGDAMPEDCSEKYCLYVLDESLAATKSALESRYGITAKSAAELPSDIYPGEANIIIVIGVAE